MTGSGVPPPVRGPFGRASILLSVILAVAAVLVLAVPVTTWRTGADEGFYLRYATRVAGEGPGALPALFQEFLNDPTAMRLYPSPTRLTAIAYDALAVRLAGPRYEALAYGSALAFLGVIPIAFVVARRLLGEPAAVLATLLVATSPLALGMARRALTDSLNAFLMTACLALVIHGIAARREDARWWGVTSLACAATFLAKELNLVLVAFAAAFFAVDALRHRRRPSLLAVACVSVVPMVLAAAVLALAAGGTGVAWRTLAASVTQSGGNDYLRTFGSGPWYSYFLDHLLLSPWTSLLYVVWIGYALGTRLDDDELRAWTLVPPLFLLGMVPLVKLVRWTLFLDVPIRLGVAALLISQAPSRRVGAFIGLVALALVASQLAIFHRLFVAGDVYDPTSAELLIYEGFLPRR
jgi:4-amino-4-deoxy-L-arabinose transferase-like glycosyltransferase